jgi:hypothetical protein
MNSNKPYNIEFQLEDLVQFILRARLHGYAGSAAKLKKPQRSGFKEFPPYAEGDFEYVDSYTGFYFAPGQEVVRFRGVPVWAMSYNGGMLPEFHGQIQFAKNTYDFLKKALLKVEGERPFRGPRRFEEDVFLYVDESEGDIASFRGAERIFYTSIDRDGHVWFRDKEVYRQDYIGGLIIHKKSNE